LEFFIGVSIDMQIKLYRVFQVMFLSSIFLTGSVVFSKNRYFSPAAFGILEGHLDQTKQLAVDVERILQGICKGWGKYEGFGEDTSGHYVRCVIADPLLFRLQNEGRMSYLLG
jgi:hypothetical protein